MLRLAVAIIFIILGLTSNAQNIQWASKVDFHYNGSADEGIFSAQMVLGPPDADSYGNESPMAFSLKEESMFGTITVEFETPMKVSQVYIAENTRPGKITEVILIATDGSEETIYNMPAMRLNRKSRLLTIDAKYSGKLINKVCVHLNTLAHPGFAQIDAIGITDKVLDNPEIPGLEGLDTGEELSQVEFFANKEILSTNINSDYREQKPVISPDGKTLYFLRENSPENIGGKRDVQDIYYSEYYAGMWSKAKNIGTPLNDKGNNAIISVSPDGKTVWVINAYNESGEVDEGLSVSHKTTTGWTKPKALEINNFHNRGYYQDYCMSVTGNILILALEMDDTQGDQDLYVSFKNEGDTVWSAPLNLGKTINSARAEFSPFLAADNKTLFFSSDRPGGFGQSDIYYSRRTGDDWQSWSTPTNIGDKINTKGSDSYFTVSATGDFAYFSSDDNSFNQKKGVPNTNIYRISMSQDVKIDATVTLKGRVLHSSGFEPIDAQLRYISFDGDDQNATTSNKHNGEYSIEIPAGKKYEFSASAEGFVDMFKNLDFSEVKKSMEVELDLFLTPFAVGQIVLLRNLFFVQSKAEMLPESEPELNKLVELMTVNPNMEIELGGHTDNQGSKAANMKLSEKRAEAVMEYLTNKGISKRRITAKGYGPTKPIESNQDAESRAKNRRVEVTILKL